MSTRTPYCTTDGAGTLCAPGRHHPGCGARDGEPLFWPSRKGRAVGDLRGLEGTPESRRKTMLGIDLVVNDRLPETCIALVSQSGDVVHVIALAEPDESMGDFLERAKRLLEGR